MFDSTIKIFDEYYRAMDANGEAGFVKDLGCEVRERLQQLSFIVNRVLELEEVAKQALGRSQAAFKEHVESLPNPETEFENTPVPTLAKATKEEIQIHREALFETKLLTESFYYFAGRIRTIIRYQSEPLPRLKSFEAEGVRNVRNKLLEHAESKDSKVLIQSFGFGGACGPVIKAIRYTDQRNIFRDAGLYKNAREFKKNLEAQIAKVIGRA